MIALRALQLLLVLSASCGLWYAHRCNRRLESVNRWRTTAVVTCSLIALVGTQILPLVWLVTGGTKGEAILRKIDCESGQKPRLHFEFDVNGKKVSDVAPTLGGPDCELLRVGDTGSVTFIQSSPQIHAWGDLRVHLNEHLAALLFVAVVAPLVVFLGLGKR